MDTKKTINIWIGPPIGADSRTRYNWQCKTLAAWIGSSEEAVRETLQNILDPEVDSLHEQFMQMSSERFGSENHPYLHHEQMCDALYPILVHVVDVAAALNPPMNPVRESVDKTRLFNLIGKHFQQQTGQLPSRFNELLNSFGFFEAFSILCQELENIVVKSNEMPEQGQSN